MNNKEIIGDFIDSIVNNDENKSKELFSTIASDTLRNLINTNNAVMEQIVALLNEKVDMGDGFYYEGTSIYLNGRAIGTVEYSGTDEFGEGSTMYFVGRDGESISFPTNDFYELSEYVKRKYLKGYK